MKVFMMWIKLLLAALLFLLPSNSCSFKDYKNSKIKSENLADIDVPDGLVTEHNKTKTSGHAVKPVARGEHGELTDNNDYRLYPLCGDKPINA